MDNAIVNVPLAKRGDINAQLDAYKASQARDAKRAAKESAKTTAALRAQAKAIVAAMPDERVAELAAKCKTTPANVRKLMLSNAHWQPALVIKAEGRAEVAA
jgi:hypothetical protein